jgi:pilus assembly protein Flp/PilA
LPNPPLWCILGWKHGSLTVNVGGRRWYPMIFLPGEEGQGLVEYALILLFIAIAVIAILIIVGPAVGNMYSSVVQAFDR